METSINDFAENITDVATLETGSDFYSYPTNSPDPEDEGGDEEEGEDSSKGSEDDPPLDEEVVHSPVPPKTGNPK
jgi:hypothetical protein